MQLSTRKRALSSSPAQQHMPTEENLSQNIPTPLFFNSAERRKDLFQQETSETPKRLRIDSPVFSNKGLTEGIDAQEPAAREALMGLVAGDLIFYGNYFEKNKLLRTLTFEREARLRFKPHDGKMIITSGVRSMDHTGGDFDDL